MKARVIKRRIPKPEFPLVAAQLIVGPTTSPWHGAIMCFTAPNQAICISKSWNSNSYVVGQRIGNLHPHNDPVYWRLLSCEETLQITNFKTLKEFISHL